MLSAWRGRPSFERFSRVANHGIILVGFLLLLMQLHGYLHTQNPTEFGFDTDGHAHAHEDLDETPDSAPNAEHVHDPAPTSTPHDNL